MRQTLTMATSTMLMSAAALVALGGCGSFQFAPGSVVSKRLVSEYHPNGLLKTQGWIGINDQGVAVKTDQWQSWYDNGQPQWRGFYVNNAIDGLREWQEWNRNGSLRDTWIDR